MDKIENSVAAWVHSSNQVRPRYGTLRRNACRQTFKRPLLSEPREVRHFAFGHKLRQQVGVKAIHPKDDHFSCSLIAAAGALAGQNWNQGGHARRQHQRYPKSFSEMHNDGRNLRQKYLAK